MIRNRLKNGFSNTKVHCVQPDRWEHGKLCWCQQVQKQNWIMKIHFPLSKTVLMPTCFISKIFIIDWIKQFIVKKYCCTFHQFFKYCSITKHLTEYCKFTLVIPKKTEVGDKLWQLVGKCCCPKCSLDRLGWYVHFFCLITMLQNKDADHHFWTVVSKMLVDSWINELLYEHIVTVWPPFINYL